MNRPYNKRNEAGELLCFACEHRPAVQLATSHNDGIKEPICAECTETAKELSQKRPELNYQFYPLEEGGANGEDL